MLTYQPLRASFRAVIQACRNSHLANDLSRTDTRLGSPHCLHVDFITRRPLVVSRSIIEGWFRLHNSRNNPR